MASQAELIEITRNPVPNGAVSGTFAARDGLSIRFARWDTTAARRLGTICLFHGRTEFIEKYFETITDLRRRGFAVATMDWRGQGGSRRLLKNPAKGHAENFAHYDADVATFMSEIVLPDCPPPYFCLAHSMGGHLVLRLTQTKVCWWDRMVLTAPMIRFAGSDAKNSGVCAAAEAATFLGLGDSFIPGLEKLCTGRRCFRRQPPYLRQAAIRARLRSHSGRAASQHRRPDNRLGYGGLQFHCNDQLRGFHGERQGSGSDCRGR